MDIYKGSKIMIILMGVMLLFSFISQLFFIFAPRFILDSYGTKAEDIIFKYSIIFIFISLALSFIINKHKIVIVFRICSFLIIALWIVGFFISFIQSLGHDHQH